MYVKSNHGWFKHADFIGLDIMVLESMFFVSYGIRHGFTLFGISGMYRELAVMLLLMHVVVVFLLEIYEGILRRGHFRELKVMVKYNFVLSAGLMSYMLFRKNTGDYSRFTIVLFVVLNTIMMYAVHELYKKYLLGRNLSKRKMQRMLLVTEKERADEVVTQILQNEYGVTRLTGIILIDECRTGEQIGGIPVVACKKEMYEYARVHIVDEVLVNVATSAIEPIIEGFLFMGITVHVDIESFLDIRGGIVNQVDGVNVITTSINSVTARQLFVKRCIDISSSLVGILATMLVTVVVAPIILIQSPGPIFFTQERVGKNGRKFHILKFRSMYADAEERKKELMAENEMQGLMFKMTNDPRITPVGKFLRRTSLDELPQFFNILKGDMSLVGTRPPTVDEYEQYELGHKSRLATKPGLTGMWQVSGRNEITDFQDVVKLDNEYIRTWSLSLDLKIVWKTIGVVLKGRGAG